VVDTFIVRVFIWAPRRGPFLQCQVFSQSRANGPHDKIRSSI